MKFTVPMVTTLLFIVTGIPALSQSPTTVHRAPPRITQQIDGEHSVTLPGNVRKDLTRNLDLGPVEDGLPLRLFMVLQRTPEQQADLDNLLARLQQPTAAEFHKWLTPREFGARFGASPQDIAKITAWLEASGMHVNGVQNNATFIDFTATAGQVRSLFHTQLHYFNKEGGRYPALVHDPMIPTALMPVVAGIQGLNKIPHHASHTQIRPTSYDAATHRWHNTEPAGASPEYSDGAGNLDVTPQDLYTIYNVNKVFSSGNLAKNATVAVIEESDIEFGTVNGSTGVATGGDVATFRSLFGVPGTLNMHVYHGYGTVTCSAPGIDPNHNGEEGEAALDAEWASATAPSANLIFMSCDQNPDNGITTAMMALIDNNLSDVMSLSYGNTELNFTSSDYSAQDSMYAQAATQGQTIFVSAGDSGSDVADQNTAAAATSGINVSAFGSPLVTVAGGTDFVDTYDSQEGGNPQSTYWGATNSTYYGNALSYIPETSWNASCASSILAKLNNYTGAGYCAQGPNVAPVNGDVVGGSGGFSTHYPTPSYQSGILGYSGSNRAQPDIAGFASAGNWSHALISCDSYVAASACTSPSTFGAAGGTSFVAPYMAGVAGLLVNYTGSRQGLLNPTLYALAKAQFTASGTKQACYSNGQTSNTGVTSSLPASTCIFNDVTSSNNDVPCQAGATNCYVNAGASYGMLSLTNSNSLTVAFSSAPGYDEVSGIGTVNVYNLITKWNTAFTSSTGLSANPTSISTSQSTQLTATVTGGTPAGYVDTPPAVTGSVSFAAGSTPLGNCTLSGATCSVTVNGTSLQVGTNSITATYTGSGTYPASTSSAQTVTVTSANGTPQTITFNPISSQTVGTQLTLSATATSGLPVAFASSTTNICTVSGTTANLANTGTCSIVASQAGNGTYAPATPVTQTFTVTTTAGLGFIPVTPCRVVDTRGSTGSLGGPALAAGSTRSFPLPAGACGLPANASAYSVNVTVVPANTLGYLSLWPTGQPQPVVSTLNSLDGRIVANAAIVPAGTSGSVSVYATDQTNVIIDVNGYFGAAGSSGALSFVPVTPCRVEDTRAANGPFGGPILAAGSTRSFTVPSSACNIPSTASAYSLNATVVPTNTLSYLTLFPAGISQPVVSTLNSYNGQVVANAALVPAGTNGAISAYVTDETNLITDINGYFTSNASTPLVFNAVTPCRVADTRKANGPLGGPVMTANSTRSFPIPTSTCGIPSGVAAYALNVTVVPSGVLNYLTLWPAGQSQPTVSTLNSYNGQIVANAALVPAGSAGAVDVFVTNQTQVILDIVGYFSTAP